MLIFPAIDLKDGTCVRLRKGDYETAHKVAEDPLETAKTFEKAGAKWIHMVDLDGAKAKKPVNDQIIFDVVKNTGLKVEIGGGIRDMETIRYYLDGGVARVILGSVALKDPELVKEAIETFGRDRIVVGIDAMYGKVAAEGWTDRSQIDYIDLAKAMEQIGVKTIIFTDISRDGMLTGPNLEMLKALNEAVSCDIVASGGICDLDDVIDCRDLNLYGTICGKSLYSGNLNLQEAIHAAREIMIRAKNGKELTAEQLDGFFKKNDLLPAIIQEASTKEVLMLAYMNRESLQRTLETGYTWFYSRSRQELWNKGATSGHYQKVLSVCGDCDDDTLLVLVEQTGAACHTGNHTCFFNEIWRNNT